MSDGGPSSSSSGGGSAFGNPDSGYTAPVERKRPAPKDDDAADVESPAKKVEMSAGGPSSSGGGSAFGDPDGGDAAPMESGDERRTEAVRAADDQGQLWRVMSENAENRRQRAA